MKKLLALFILLYQGTVMALPYADVQVYHFKNKADGTHTYLIAHIINNGPIAENVATKPDHVVYDWTGVPLPAGGISLNDDENIFQFGVDTLRDDVTITDVTNGIVLRAGDRSPEPSPFNGIVMDAFADTDNDQIPNKIIIWNLADETQTADALKVGDSIRWVKFTSDKELNHFNVWVQGTDDDVVWIEANDTQGTFHGEHGHFFFDYAAQEGKYLSVIFERNITPKSWGR